MTRCDWPDLPPAVQDAVAVYTGQVEGFEAATAGATADLTGTVHLAAGGRLFCKAIQTDRPQAWMHRTEARALRTLPAGLGPTLIDEIEVDGWLVLLTEHLDGRHLNVAPGSPDLPAAAAALASLSAALTPSPIEPVQPLTARWAAPLGWAKLVDQVDSLDEWSREHLDHLVELEGRAPAAVDGATLAHTDPVPQNLLIDQTGAIRVIDWAWPARAAAWIDTTLLLLRLIDAGHEPIDAETWAARVPAWADADPDAVTAAAVAIAGLWMWRGQVGGDPRRQELAAVACRWVRYRIERFVAR